MGADMFKQYATTGLLWDMADAYANAEFQSRVTLPSINENLKDSEGHLYGFAPTYTSSRLRDSASSRFMTGVTPQRLAAVSCKPLVSGKASA